MSVNCANWSIMTTLSSRSAASASCSDCHDRPSTTSPYRLVNPPCGSWPGSMPLTSRIPLPVAGERCSTWQEKASRSAVTVSETLCGTRIYGRSIRDQGRQFLVAHPSVFPAWWTSSGSRPQIRSRRRISPTSRCGRASCTWWPLSICTHGMFSAGNSPTALTRSFAWRPWRWLWPVAASHRSFTRIRGVIHLWRLRGAARGRRDRDQLVREGAVLLLCRSLRLCQHPGGEALAHR
jgi:hypothetical protein